MNLSGNQPKLDKLGQPRMVKTMSRAMNARSKLEIMTTLGGFLNDMPIQKLLFVVWFAILVPGLGIV